MVCFSWITVGFPLHVEYLLYQCPTGGHSEFFQSSCYCKQSCSESPCAGLILQHAQSPRRGFALSLPICSFHKLLSIGLNNLYGRQEEG